MLPPDYIAGFVDGEGCFALKYRANRKFDANGNKLHEYFYWSAEFVIVLHPSDQALLEEVRKTLKVGKISLAKTTKQVRYSVQDTKELASIIVPFFREHSMYGRKNEDFKLWAEAVGLLAAHRAQPRTGQSRPLDPTVEARLIELKRLIDKHKSHG
jgi:hypothetical protein